MRPLIRMICVFGALAVIGCASPPLPAEVEVEVTREVPVTREVESIREVMVEIEVTRQVEITREVPVTRLVTTTPQASDQPGDQPAEVQLQILAINDFQGQHCDFVQLLRRGWASGLSWQPTSQPSPTERRTPCSCRPGTSSERRH